MTDVVERPPRTLDEFRSWHERQDRLYEFIDGRVVPVPATTRDHNEIVANVRQALKLAVRPLGWRVFHEQITLEVTGGGASLQPDVVVEVSSDGGAGLGGSTRVKAPLIVVEVLSKATRRRDLGVKRRLYEAFPGILHLLLIEQTERRVLHLTRGADGRLAEATAADPLRLDPPGIALPLASIYEDTDVPAPGGRRGGR